MTTRPSDVWAIGDVQGCAAPLEALLAHPELDRDDIELWFAGDLVNRGPDSLGALRRIIALGARARCVLGNHDLHLLAVAAGVRKPSKSDTLADILKAPDATALIDWLRTRPLFIRAHGHVLVHAGILPAWTLEQAQALAQEVEQALRSDQWRERLDEMYGERPLAWHDDLQGPARLRVIVNALTRMRVCRRSDGQMVLRHKGPAPAAGGELGPWFDVPARRDPSVPIVFGHWSALGLCLRPDALCLDSGCVWGRQLTALRLRDRRVIQQDCPGRTR